MSNANNLNMKLVYVDMRSYTCGIKNQDSCNSFGFIHHSVVWSCVHQTRFISRWHFQILRTDTSKLSGWRLPGMIFSFHSLIIYHRETALKQYLFWLSRGLFLSTLLSIHWLIQKQENLM